MNAIAREWEFEGARVCDGCDPEGNVFQIRQAVWIVRNMLVGSARAPTLPIAPPVNARSATLIRGSHRQDLRIWAHADARPVEGNSRPWGGPLLGCLRFIGRAWGQATNASSTTPPHSWRKRCISWCWNLGRKSLPTAAF